MQWIRSSVGKTLLRIAYGICFKMVAEYGGRRLPPARLQAERRAMRLWRQAVRTGAHSGAMGANQRAAPPGGARKHPGSWPLITPAACRKA